NDGGDVRLDLAACDQDEQRDDGHRGCDRRQHGVVERIIDLIPVHYVFSPSTFWRCRPAWTAGALASIFEGLWQSATSNANSAPPNPLTNARNEMAPCHPPLTAC